jgi:hypothetical protein
MSGYAPGLCQNIALTPEEQKSAEAAERRVNLHECMIGAGEPLCNYELLTQPQKAAARQAELEANRRTCLSGGGPALCNYELLSDHEKSLARNAEVYENIRLCLVDPRSVTCDFEHLPESAKADVNKKRSDDNRRSCLSGDAAPSCDYTLLSGTEAERAKAAAEERNYRACLHPNSGEACRLELLSPTQIATVAPIRAKSNRDVCFSQNGALLCDETLLSTADLQEFRAHLSQSFGGDIGPSDPPMSGAKREQVLSAHLPTGYWVHLMSHPKHLPITGAVIHIVEERDPISDQYGLVVCWIELTATVTLEVRDIRREGQLTAMYQNTAAPSDIALVTGGYWQQSGPDLKSPIGLVVVDGIIRNQRASWSQGGFVVSERGVISIRPVGSTVTTQASAALQSKPILVWSGESGIRGEDYRRADRVAVGTNTSGQVVIVGAFRHGSAIRLSEFADVLRSATVPSGPALISALNLDGGPAAHLFVPALHQHWGNSSTYFLNNLLTFRVPR